VTKRAPKPPPPEPELPEPGAGRRWELELEPPTRYRRTAQWAAVLHSDRSPRPLGFIRLYDSGWGWKMASRKKSAIGGYESGRVVYRTPEHAAAALLHALRNRNAPAWSARSRPWYPPL
jgi:hypothetical protein